MKNLSILYSENDNVSSNAVYSPCKKYRYELTRQWSDNNKRMLFILLNPSTATERKNDPTVERCEKRARNLNYGAYRVCNIFSYRATNPLELRNSADPVGPDNISILIEGLKWANKVVCGWGNNGFHLRQGENVEKILRFNNIKTFHLGLTKKKCPKHPLYVSYEKSLESWF